MYLMDIPYSLMFHWQKDFTHKIVSHEFQQGYNMRVTSDSLKYVGGIGNLVFIPISTLSFLEHKSYLRWDNATEMAKGH